MSRRARSNRRTCHGHRRYRDQQEAKGALRRIRSFSSRAKVPVRAFWCPRCRGWHLTSQAPRSEPGGD